MNAGKVRVGRGGVKGALACRMDVIILMLAVAGFLAALRGLSRSALGLMVRGVEEIVAREATDIQARRGDLTGLQDADAHTARARSRRRRSILAVAFWVVLLLLPPLTPWTAALYAAWSPLWLLPPRRR